MTRHEIFLFSQLLIHIHDAKFSISTDSACDWLVRVKTHSIFVTQIGYNGPNTYLKASVFKWSKATLDSGDLLSQYFGGIDSSLDYSLWVVVPTQPFHLSSLLEAFCQGNKKKYVYYDIIS